MNTNQPTFKGYKEVEQLYRQYPHPTSFNYTGILFESGDISIALPYSTIQHITIDREEETFLLANGISYRASLTTLDTEIIFKQ